LQTTVIDGHGNQFWLAFLGFYSDCSGIELRMFNHFSMAALSFFHLYLNKTIFSLYAEEG
jgi:hypothetical protein